jgi:GNAT superfamily N-acetyltransferase
VAALDIRPVEPPATRPLRQEVLRPHESLEELASHEPPGVHAVAAFDGDELIACGFVCPDGEPGAWRVRGMATKPQARGRGAGSAILERLVQHAREQGATRVWCNARTPAISLYARAGFAVTSEEFEIPEIGPHVVMELRLQH